MAAKPLLFVAALLLLPACPSSSPSGTGGKTGPNKKVSSSGGTSSNNDAGAPEAAALPEGEVGFSAPDASLCMFHPGAKAYHRCLSAADGTCFHFGETCTPVESC